MKRAQLLYITRKYPPSVGGMQKVNARLSAHLLARRPSVGEGLEPGDRIAWGGSQIALPLFLLYALVKALYLCHQKATGVIFLGDGLLAPLGLFLRSVCRRPVIALIHGRDITFAFPPYQWIIPRALARLDRVVCMSEALRQECLRRGIPADRCRVIPPGLDVNDDLPPAADRGAGPPVLLSAARLVPKKGIHWFVEQVMPALHAARPDIRYRIAGDGPLRPQIAASITHHHLQGVVELLGELPMDSPALRSAFAQADLFLMPNVPTPGDMEGFGLVALEAAAAGLPVIAAGVEGVREAVIEGETGWLLPPGDVNAFVTTILERLADRPALRRFGEQARQTALARFSWQQITEQYDQLLQSLTT